MEAISFKQHSETVMVWNYQNADCSLKNKFIVLFIIIFGTLSFPTAATQIDATPETDPARLKLWGECYLLLLTHTLSLLDLTKTQLY